MSITSINHIKDICKELDIRLTKSKGQNFLIDADVLAEIVSAADIKKDDVVLEIGPGLGGLTEELTKRAGRVVAVEVDHKLFSYLEQKFKKADNLKLVEGDIIQLFNYSIVRWLGSDYKLVANLPYQITSKILRLLLASETPPSEMAVMVQKEVGERICAQAGQMSVLAVMVQYYAEPKIVRVVERNSFWPVPEVDSVILYIKTKKHKNRKTEEQEENFFRMVKIGFSSRRKMLRKNLSNIFALAEVDAALQRLGINLKARAQELSLEQWKELADILTYKL